MGDSGDRVMIEGDLKVMGVVECHHSRGLPIPGIQEPHNICKKLLPPNLSHLTCARHGESIEVRHCRCWVFQLPCIATATSIEGLSAWGIYVHTVGEDGPIHVSLISGNFQVT